MSSPAPVPAYSVVIPFYNEAGALPGLLAELRGVMDGLGQPYEVLAVDDGSRDATPQILTTAAAGWPQLRPLRQEPNAGQSAALLRGLHAASAPWIITLDGDGQNLPADIPRLLDAARDTGADMVVGIRAQRRDSWLRRAMSRLANGVRGRILADGLQDSGCALKVFRRDLVASFWSIRSLYSFMPAFAVAAGARLAEVPVQHRERRTGTSNYGLGTFAWRPLVDTLALWWLLRCRPARRPAAR